MSETTDPRTPAAGDVDAAKAERLSALLDGELDVDEIPPLSAAWGRDAGLRQQWQAYGLIGDVLRTGAPAQGPSHDQQLFDAIRARLAQEPVVLAPRPQAAQAETAGAQVYSLPAAQVRRAFWRRRGIPAAGIAAGLAFVSVMVWKLPQPVESGRDLANAPSLAPATVVAVSASAATGTAAAATASPDNLSDASALPMRPYLQAHRAMTAGFALDPGPGQLRRVAQEQVAR
ncbi:MAG: hypothetical protein RLZZ524_1534 [Pseudomonadota bacterium]|jgi:sigma-E factor negative regulatory protein RseA